MSSSFTCCELQVILTVKNIEVAVTGESLAPISELIGLRFLIDVILYILRINIFFYRRLLLII